MEDGRAWKTNPESHAPDNSSVVRPEVMGHLGVIISGVHEVVGILWLITTTKISSRKEKPDRLRGAKHKALAVGVPTRHICVSRSVWSKLFSGFHVMKFFFLYIQSWGRYLWYIF